MCVHYYPAIVYVCHCLRVPLFTCAIVYVCHCLRVPLFSGGVSAMSAKLERRDWSGDKLLGNSIPKSFNSNNYTIERLIT